jgi:TatD DNase family protein
MEIQFIMSDIIQFFDTHCHLNSTQFDADRLEVLARMQDHGVTRFLEIGYDLASSERAVALAGQVAGCWAVVGIQPNYPVSAADSEWQASLLALAQRPRVVAIGEIGFDHYHQRASVAEQEALFRAQIDMAATLKLPIVIHSRDAHADTLRVLRDVRHPYGVVMHSFAGDVAYAEACLELGCTLSLSGPITFKNNHVMHEVVQAVPLERLCIETDSPYLAPHPHRGHRNEPTYVVAVATQIAALKGISVAEVAAQSWRTAQRVFGIEA